MKYIIFCITCSYQWGLELKIVKMYFPRVVPNQRNIFFWSSLRILGRINSRRVHSQRRHTLKIYLSLNLRIRFECLNRHRWHVELWTCWLKLLISLIVAVRIRHAVTRHRRWGECLLEKVLLSIGHGLLLWSRWSLKVCWLLHWIIVELVHVIHWDCR